MTDPEEFARLREEWNRALTESPADTLFLRHEWLGLWWAHFGKGRRLAVMTARRGGRLVAALPLMEQRETYTGIRFKALRSTTNAHSFRFNAICSRGEEAAMEAIWAALRDRRDRWDAVILEEVPEDAPVLDPMLRAARRGGHPMGSWRGGEVPYLETVGTWDAYVATLGRNMRSNLKKKSRRLREAGEVTFRSVSSPGEVEDALRVGLRLEGSGWKAEAGSAILSDPTLTRFYSEWASVAAEKGWLRLSFLDVDGMPVAFDFSTLYHGCYYDLKMGYDPAWSAYSVGQLIKAEILRRCFESDTRVYDFLGVSMRAKEDWMPRTRAHQWHYVYSKSPRARLLHLLKFGVVPAARRLLRS